MALPQEHPFRKHAENLAAVRQGLVQIERLHKAAIRRNDAAAVTHCRRMHLLTVGMLAEAFLAKICSDPSGFNERERHVLWSERSQIDRWIRAIDLAFRRHFAVLLHEDPFTSLPQTEATQYALLQELLDQELRPVIEYRNKAAHSQWVWLLNSKGTQFSGKADPPPNYRGTWARARLIEELADLIHILVVSEPTFQRDYDRSMTKVGEYRSNIDGADYSDFVAHLQRTKRPRT